STVKKSLPASTDMCTEMKSFQRGSLAPFRRSWNTVTPKHVCDSLVRDVVAEICESAGDPIVAPRPVLLGHADDQGLDLRADLWPSRRGAHLGSIELAGDQTTVPAENRLRLGDTGDIGEQLPAEPFTDFSKCRRSESESRTLSGRCDRR